ARGRAAGELEFGVESEDGNGDERVAGRIAVFPVPDVPVLREVPVALRRRADSEIRGPTVDLVSVARLLLLGEGKYVLTEEKTEARAQPCHDDHRRGQPSQGNAGRAEGRVLVVLRENS